MTSFYILMFYIYKNKYKAENTKKIECIIWILAIIRIILSMLSQNNWITNDGSLMMGRLRNIPFTIMGLIIIVIYYKKRAEYKEFKYLWLNVLLSFVFYLIVVLGTEVVSALGAFMIPKTVCYILTIVAFAKMINKNEE